MGLGNIEGMKALDTTQVPTAAYGKCAELSDGKDTTVGHWEMVGIETKVAFPTYPKGFPAEVIDEFVKRTGVPGVLGNCTASGTEIIERLGEEHAATGKPIVYTSADSVSRLQPTLMSYLLRDSMNYAALRESCFMVSTMFQELSQDRLKAQRAIMRGHRTEEIMPFFLLRIICLCTLRMPGRMS